MDQQSPIRVLYSFPQKLGAGRVCYTAWQQVRSLARAGAHVVVYPGTLHRPVPDGVEVRTTLSRGRARVSYRLLGMRRACGLHDLVVGRRLPSVADEIDIIHCWPLGARRTLRIAAGLGVPTMLERPNAHTGYAYRAVQQESDRLGIALPRGFEHAYDPRVLSVESEEYESAYRLLCPSEFVVRTFEDEGFEREKLARHIYGYDEQRFFPSADPRGRRPFTMLFAGFAAVRKGLHFALDAWLRSSARQDGQFLIAGEIMPAYGEYLSESLDHPSVKVLGHRDDIPELMRNSDVLVLPSVEEGFGLVCVEAMGSGCVPLVSDACTDECVHGRNSLVHPVGAVDLLSEQISSLFEDRSELERLRDGAVASAANLTWDAAATRLVATYREAIDSLGARDTPA